MRMATKSPGALLVPQLSWSWQQKARGHLHPTAFDHLQADAFWQADQATDWVHMPAYTQS